MVIQKPVTIDVIRNEVKNLDSKIELLQEKINSIENTQDIIGRTIISINQKLKGVEEKQDNGTNTAAATSSQENSDKYITKEEFNKLKYTIDMINPLDFATIEQVKDLIKELKGEKKEIKDDSNEPKEIKL